MKNIRAIIFFFSLSFLTACSPKQVTIYCEPQNASIYVNGLYQGQGIVKYPIPPKQKYFVISCTLDGESFVSRNVHVRNIKSDINIYLRDPLRYSQQDKTLSTH